MDVWGLMLNCVGAVLIATGQEIVTRVTDMWLRAHEAFLVSLGSRDVQRSECSGLLIKSDQVTRCVAENTHVQNTWDAFSRQREP